MQVRAGYVNPLSMMDRGRASFTNKLRPSSEKTEDLQLRKQQLQNTLLLMKSSGTDAAASTAELQEELEAQLEEVSAELKTSGGGSVKADSQLEKTEAPAAVTSRISMLRRMDVYEKDAERMESPGIYQMKRTAEGYKISFLPYAE